MAQAPVLLSLEKVHARVDIPTNAHVLLVSAASLKYARLAFCKPHSRCAFS